MLFNVEVVSESEYEAYIESLRDLGQEGQLSTEYDRNQNQPGAGVPELKEEHEAE
jgi:cytochrome c oxidase subunit 2